MTDEVSDAKRRALLQVVAGVSGSLALGQQRAHAGVIPPVANAKAGDFNFLTGEWRIQNRKLNGSQWEEFAGEATVISLLGGVVSVEELRIPTRNFSGMGLRLLDVERKLWADHWVNAKSGVLTPPPTWGSFVDGVGMWDSEETKDGKSAIYRGVWDRISARSCRWYQASSSDGGRTWEQSWTMDWTRAGA